VALTEWFVKQAIGAMSKEDKERAIVLAANELISSLDVEDRKKIIKELMPTVLDGMMKEMSADDKKEIMQALMPALMMQMAAGGGLAGLLQAFRTPSQPTVKEDRGSGQQGTGTEPPTPQALKDPQDRRQQAEK
jgi:hypothetical protein